MQTIAEKVGVGAYTIAMITFDFDETLTQPIWNERHQKLEGSSNPNQDVIAQMKKLHSQGKNIAVVTSRLDDKEVTDFIEQYNLPVSSIYCTAGKIKARTLKNVGSELHFDDGEHEAIANKELDIKTMMVRYHYDRASNSVVCKFAPFD